MNKTSPKKIMEIIFIFVIPMLLILVNGDFYSSKSITTEENDGIIVENHQSYTYFEYETTFAHGGPIEKILQIPFNLLGFENSYASNILIDYTALWFIMFILWHLLYLFFDTLMHKVLLRKE